MSCHLHIMTVLLLPFQSGCLLFLLLIWLLWKWHSVLSWVREVKVGIPGLVPILRGTLVVFVCWLWCWQWVCHIWPLLCLGMLPLFPLCYEVFFFINGCWVLWNVFSASTDMIMWFLSFILFIWCITFIDLWILY